MSTPATPAPDPGKKRRYLAYFGANSLALSILAHILFGVLATYWVVEHFQKKHINFHATEPPSQHTEVEHKIEMTKRNNVESAPPDLKRIVTTAVSPITLPDVPDVPQTDEITPTAVSGIDGTIGEGLGGGLGSGGSGGGGGGMTIFGAADGNGLEGYLYDLKQTSDRQQTGMTPEHYHQILMNFVGSDWDEKIVDQYYKFPKPLYTTQIMIPNMDSQEGPKAFGADSEVQPKMWIVWYRGKVSVPTSGDYRFAGFCDDILLVRIGGRTVLDGSIFPVATQLSVNTPWPNDWSRKIPEIPNYGQMREGSLVQMTAGEATDMDIIIGEEPGGDFNAFLFVLKDGENYPTTTSGVPLLPLFQLRASSSIPGGVHPPVNTDNPEPWQQAAR